MSEINLYQKALDHIENIEYEHGIHMDHEEFINRTLPAYFNIKIDNVNDNYQGHIGIIYTFEVKVHSKLVVIKVRKLLDQTLLLLNSS